RSLRESYVDKWLSQNERSVETGLLLQAERLVTPGSRSAALLFELGVLALELLEGLERLSAVFHQTETPTDAGEHVIVRGRARVHPARLVHHTGGLCQVSLALVCPPQLKQRAIRFGIERERAASVLERFVRIPRPVVVGAQVHVRQSVCATVLFVQGNGLPIHRHGALVVAERLEREAERVHRLHVSGLDMKRRLERFPRTIPAVLNGKQLAEIVVTLCGIRLVANGLLELDLGRVESSDDHQVAAKDLVRLGIADVELERFRERANGLADLLLAEQAVTERIPSPRGCRALLHVGGEQRF